MKSKLGIILAFIFSFTLIGCDGFKFDQGPLLIDSEPDKVIYTVGECFDTTGLVITNSSKSVITDYSITPANGSLLPSAGDFPVTVSKPGYTSASFYIKVNDMITSSLVIDSLPNKTTYNINEALDLTGLHVTDQNGNEVSEYSTSILDKTTLTQTGELEIIITKYGYVSTSFTILVLQPSSKILTIESLPTKVDYILNEYLSLNGLIVKAEGQQIHDYTTSIANNTQLTETGTIDIVVSKQNYVSTSFSIYVRESAPTKTNHKIDINYINDTHGAFMRQNTESNPYETGMSCLTEYFLSCDQDTSILLSGGDMCQGGWESNSTRGLIMADAMNIAGFDAMVLGNHELDWGEPALKTIAEQLDAPLIACNVFYSSDKKTRPDYLEPYVIIEKDGVLVGIIGAVEKNLGSSITGSVSSAFYFPDPTSYIKDYSDLLKTKYNCDVVVAAMHDGGFTSGTFGFLYNDLLETSTISQEPYIDGIFLAHDHMNKEGKLSTTSGAMVPYLEAGKNGRAVGCMTFEVYTTQTESNISNSYANVNSYAYSSYTTANEDVDELLVKYKDQIGDPNAVICTFKQSYTKAEFTELIAKAMYWYVNKNKGMFNGATVYFSTHNYGGVRVNYISSGDFTYSDLTTTTPFDNEICIQTCTRENISYMSSSSYYASYKETEPLYVGGVTTAVSISYIAENEHYSSYCQQSYVKYAITAKEILIVYLKTFNGTL